MVPVVAMSCQRGCCICRCTTSQNIEIAPLMFKVKGYTCTESAAKMRRILLWLGNTCNMWQNGTGMETCMFTCHKIVV